MNATMIISSVRDPNPWNKDGQLKGHFINGAFDDGMNFSLLVMGQRQAADETAAALRGIIGKPGEFEYEERTTNNGSKELKLKSWPGKPQQGGGGGFKGGGGKQWSEAWSQGRECHELNQWSIQGSVALEWATAFVIASDGPKTPERILVVATLYRDWLRTGKPPSEIPATTPIAKGEPTPQHIAAAVTDPVQESKCFIDYRKWLLEQLENGWFHNIGEAWKATYTAANQMNHTQQSLRQCTNPRTFENLKERLPWKPTAEKRGVKVPDDSELPF